MNHFYVLKSLKDNKIYKGSTSDIALRLQKHNSGGVQSTKNRRPLKLIYTEEFQNYEEALSREKYHKTFKGGKELGIIIKHL